MTTLDNGLRVVVREVKFAPVVSMAVWVGVGSADESDSEAGLAHLHEHMIFKGTARRGVGQIAAEVEGAGGEINAFTSYDQTCYYLTLGKDELERGLDILADAIGAASFDARELRKEIQVVLEEIRLYRDLPHHYISEACWSRAFSVHPYGQPILGKPAALEKLRRRDVLRFYGKHYKPTNMVLSVVGDLDTDAALAIVRKVFGPLSGARPKRVDRACEPEQKGFRGLVLQDPIRQAHLYLTWHGTSWNEEFAAELDILAMVLGHGDASRLEHRVKSMKRLVHSVSAHVFAPRDPGIFGIDAATNPELLKAALEAIFTEAYRLRHEPLREDEFERARRNIEASFIGKHETAAGISHSLGYSLSLTGGLELERDYLARVMRADRNSVREAARRFVRHGNLTAAVLVPRGASILPRDLERISRLAYEAANRTPPAAVPQRKDTPPPVVLKGEAGRRGRIQRADLSNGVRLVVCESDHSPIVSMRVLLEGGLRYEPEEENGVATLTASLLARGTAKRSAITFAKLVEGMAGEIRGISGYNTIGAAGEFLSRDFRAGLDLLAEATLQPAFRPTELKRKKEEIVGYIRDRGDSPARAVRELFAATLYANHPYGRPLLGTEASQQGLDVEQVARHWKRVCRPANLVVAVAGDVDFDEVIQRVDQTFGAMRASKFAPIKLPMPTAPEGVREVRETQPREQVHMIVGFLGGTIGSPDEYALQVLNAALSGQGGRLFTRLRDEQHLAYSVNSFHREGVEPGSFGVYIATGRATAAQALVGLRRELELAVADPPRGEELERAKRFLVGSHQLDLQTAGSVAMTMALNELFGIGYRAHLGMVEKIRRVSDRRVAEVARRYLTLDHMVVAQVGDFGESGS